MEFYPVCKVEQGFISVMPHPAKTVSLATAVKSLKDKGVDLVVSFLENAEEENLGLTQEEQLLMEQKIQFFRFEIKDHTVPKNTDKALKAIEFLFEELQKGKHLALHCKGGTGRTGTFAGALLLRAGIPSQDVFTLLTKARGKAMPATDEQKNWALNTLNC